jgi:hypothetical protein
MPQDIKKETKSISFDPRDVEYLSKVAEKYGLTGDSAVIRFIINAFRRSEEKADASN